MSRPESPQRPPPYVVAIGASGAQGLDEIRDLLSYLPADLPAVVLVVLHRPSDEISHLRAVLARASQMPVIEASDGDGFKTGRCYIGEPDAHLTLAAHSNVRLVEGSRNKHRGRTVDLLFESVAAFAKTRGIGVVLAGSLDDGSRGLAAIGKAGGATMVLSHDGAPEPGMPSNAFAFNGPIDLAGSAPEIAREIVKRVRPS